MSIEVPDGWDIECLGEISRIVTGKTPSTKSPGYWGGDIPFVTPSDIVAAPWLEGVERFVTDEGARQSNVVPAGSVLFTCIASIGKSCITDAASAFNQQINACVPKETVDPYFLYSALQAQTDAIAALAGTTAVPIINKSTFSKIDIVLPPLAEQRRIAEVLRSVDGAITAAQNVAVQSKALQASLITALCFGHNYKTVSLENILVDIRYGTSAKCDASEADGHPVLRIPNVVNGRVELADLKYASISEADLRRLRLKPDDIVLVRTNGNPAYIGRSALITDDMRGYLFASYLIRMRFDPSRACPSYIYAALNSQPVREMLLKAATTSAGNYNINTASLKSIAIPLPDLETQHQISAVIQATTNVANAYENEVQGNHKVKNNLMSDLLSGRVRVPT